MNLMQKDDWYRDRILWKANQHKLFERDCFKFSELSAESASVISKIIPADIRPVIVFWKNKSTWTALGTRSIYSYYDGKLVVSDLDEINKKLSIVSDKNLSEATKMDASFIYLEVADELIWAPSNSELFALMNILRMFPLLAKNTS